MENLRFDFGNHTDRGLVREINEDAMAFYTIHGGYLLMVADGMGGHAAGEEASKIAIESIKNSFEQLDPQKPVHQVLLHSIEVANHNIFEYSNQHPSKKGMGTTIVVAFIFDNVITVGHVGDSRLYRYNPETGLQLLTKDHSFVQELVNQGIISEEEANYHPRRNEITRALGIHENVIPDIQQHTIRPNDMFILMTDGVSSLLSFQQIFEIISNPQYNAQQIAQTLVNAANELGGYDNSTVQVIHFKNEFIHKTDQNSSINDTIKIEIPTYQSDNQSTNAKPQSATKDSVLRYYLFIAGTIVTISIIFYYFLSKSQPTNLAYHSNVTTDTIQMTVEESNPMLEPKQNLQEPLFCDYKVKKGDNLDLLSKLFNYPIDSIKALNQLNKNQIKENQKLKFPIQAVYEVTKGDKIETIAKNFEVSTKDILKINQIKKAEKLSVGQKIYIPLKENN